MLKQGKVVEIDDSRDIVLNWVMKYLPQHRETRKDFFGKNGISWFLVTKTLNDSKENGNGICQNSPK